jgi:hypothetical protein
MPPETFFSMSKRDKGSLIEQAVAQLDRPSVQLEKDIWVVETLKTLFASDFGRDLIFKGGTSLSKVYKVIQRFSGDIDVTVDIHRLLPEETKESDIPASRNQAERWKRKIREVELPKLITDEIVPALAANMPHGVKVISKLDKGIVSVDYTSLAIAPERRIGGSKPYIDTSVKIELGGFSSGRPNHISNVITDVVDAGIDGLELPETDVRVMAIERTFWEKATLAHVACIKGSNDWRRYARHWHDLALIYRSKYWADCLNAGETAELVAAVKQKFYRENPVNYPEVVAGDIRIVPDGEYLERLKADYEVMAEWDMLDTPVRSFESVADDCNEIEAALNSR